MKDREGDGASTSKDVKMYSDFKSPYAYLAFDPGMALPQRFDVSVRWIPFQLRLKGKGERSIYSEYKVKYSYMDARRWAKERGLWIRGPLKIYDTTPAAIGGLLAEKHGRLLDYGRAAFKQFFLREFEADQPEAVARLLASLGLPDRGLRALPAGSRRGPCVRRAVLHLPQRGVLGPRPDAAARATSERGRPRTARGRPPTGGCERRDVIDLFFWTTPNGYQATILLKELGWDDSTTPETRARRASGLAALKEHPRAQLREALGRGSGRARQGPIRAALAGRGRSGNAGGD